MIDRNTSNILLQNMKLKIIYRIIKKVKKKLDNNKKVIHQFIDFVLKNHQVSKKNILQTQINTF